MALFEQIRLEYEFGAGTIQGVARKLGVHRRAVREAIKKNLDTTGSLFPRAAASGARKQVNQHKSGKRPRNMRFHTIAP